MGKLKVMNYPMEQEYHQALEIVQDYYTRTSGVRISKAQALKRLLFESKNKIENTGTLFEGRKEADEIRA